MSVIPDKVKKLISKEKILIIGTSYRGIANVSPRTAFHIDSNGVIYWLEIFRHKTFRNISKNSWSSVLVFDKKNCFILESGYRYGDFIHKIEEINKDNTCVRTNHGILLPWAGYQRLPDDAAHSRKRVNTCQHNMTRHMST